MADLLDFALIERSLDLSAINGKSALDWLSDSFDRPRGFWASLHENLKALGNPPPVSRPFGAYDFFSDTVGRWAETRLPAFRSVDSTGKTRTLSYSGLRAGAMSLAAEWADEGLAPGACLCIILPMGELFVTALAAGLFSGATITVLPPLGKTWLKNRLDALNPDFVVCDRIDADPVTVWEGTVLDARLSGGSIQSSLSRSHSYESASVVFSLVDPCRRFGPLPLDLSADAAYLGAVRDGLLVLGLRPGSLICAPGFHFLETQPAMLLSTLLSGACFLHIDIEEISRNPSSLLKYDIRAMGVCTELRELMLDRGFRVGGRWGFWFRNPAECVDLDRWTQFAAGCDLVQVPSGNQCWNASLGGAVLFSRRRRGAPSQDMLPAAGVRWTLTSMRDDEVETTGGFGVFSPLWPDSSAGAGTASPFLVSQHGDELTFLRSRYPSRMGRVYPCREIEELLTEAQAGNSYCVFPCPSGALTLDSRFAVLVFTGCGPDQDEAGLVSGIRRLIEREMGREFAPDLLEIHRLYPRRMPGSPDLLDRKWCIEHFEAGSLKKMAGDKTFVIIHSIRENLLN